MPVPVIVAVVGKVMTGLALAYGAKVVAKILLTLGISLVAYKYTVGPLLDTIQQQFAGLPTSVVDTIRLLNFDKVVTLILSAVTIRTAQASAKWVVGEQS